MEEENLQLAYEQLFKLLDNQIDVYTFESWFYQNDSTLAQISSNLYEEFLLLSFKEYTSSEKLIRLIYQYIDLSGFDQWKGHYDEKELRACLNGIIQHTNDWKDLLHTCYSYFWDDGTKYSFLNVLADIGAFVYYQPESLGLSYQLLMQEAIIEEIIYPEAKEEAGKLVGWLDSKEIQITGAKDFVDNRPLAEKEKFLFPDLKQKIIARIKK